MTKSDFKPFVEMMVLLSEVYGVELSSARMQLYFEVLQEYCIEEVQYAAREVTKTKIYGKFPLPADFVAQLQSHAIDKYKVEYRCVPEEKYKILIGLYRIRKQKEKQISGKPTPVSIEHKKKDDTPGEDGPERDRSKEIGAMLKRIGKNAN